MKKVFVLFFMVILLLGCDSTSHKPKQQEIFSIDVDSVYSLLDNKDIYIIDVRETYEYKSGHVKNAYNIPIGDISGIEKMFIPYDSMIIVYCYSGGRSKNAAKMLIDMGYTNVYDMGGVNSWHYELIPS